MGDDAQHDATRALLANEAVSSHVPSAHEDEQLDIHKPKPVHSWRELVGEIGVIVVGVLIALSAEQLVEAIHWHHKVEAVQEAVRHEMVEDDLPQAYARDIIGHCLAQQLDTLRTLARPGSDGATYLKAANFYAPPIRTWDADGAKLADRSDLASHVSTEQLKAIQAPYVYVNRMEPLAVEEAAALAALQRSRYGAARLTAQDAAEISDTIDRLQSLNLHLSGFGWALLEAGKGAPGGGLPEEQKRLVLTQAREVYGACVREFVPRQGGAYSGRQVYKPTGMSFFQGL